MDQAIKRKWVKALLSGKYEQGLHYMHFIHDNSYCCLGVLRECAGLGGLNRFNLTDEELEQVNLDLEISHELIRLNDEGVPFDMIAGLIQEAL